MKKDNSFSAKRIIEVIADFYDLPVKDILGRSRKKDLVLARHVLIYILREKYHESYPKIGRRLDRRDHTTAIYAHKKIKNKLKSNLMLKQEMESIESLLENIQAWKLKKENELEEKKIIKEIRLNARRKQREKRESIDRAIISESDLDKEVKRFIFSPRISPSISKRDELVLKEWRLGRTFEEIGRKRNVTRQRIGQIVRRALLREVAEKVKDGFYINIEEFLKQEKSKRKESGLKINEPEISKKEIKKSKRWSRYYVRCRRCKTTLIPHIRKGLCKKCYAEIRGRPFDREKLISEKDSKCEICGLDRISSFRRFRRDFFLIRLNTKESSSKKYLVLCRSCFGKIMGRKMAMAKKRKTAKKRK